ncbi:MAG: trypsin-like peptidase domain-containing protein, partial [Clostridia bacterium]|nr:trypsin-like peptidase domain-containing protein [Clostridia bacterium]
MKKRIIFLLIGILLFGTMPVYGAGAVQVAVNGQTVQFDVPPQIVSDRTFVPMRAVFEALKADVQWDDATKTVISTRGETVVNVTLGTAVLYKNGQPSLLDAAPFIQEGRMLIPLRAVAESFGCAVQWDATTKTAVITDTGTPKRMLSPEEVAESILPKVFRIDLYDQAGMPNGHGSGFFIGADGIAVTNYHVIREVDSASIKTADGNVFPVTHVVAYDADKDIAVIRVDKRGMFGTVTAFPLVEIGDSRAIKYGQAVYALGNPDTYDFTFSSGIISHTARKRDATEYFQITAPTSGGSSGGLLANGYGEAIGITTAGFEHLQNINFAVPIHLLEALQWETAEEMPFSEFAQKNKRPEITVGDYKMDIR